MPESVVLQAVLVVLVAAGLMIFGYLLADAVPAVRRLDALTKWALSLPAVVAYAFVLMLAHMASGGRVFSNPWLIRTVSIAVAIALLARRFLTKDKVSLPPKQDLLAASGVVGFALLLWGTLAFRLVPVPLASADTSWHMGWTSQLLNGETTPSSMLAGDIPNYYPWMFHALAAFVRAFAPGGRAFHALPPLQLMQVAAMALALFVIGRMIGNGWIAGATTAFFGSMAAGFPLPMLRTFDLLVEAPQRAGPRGAYNVSFANLHPPLPRDVGYTLLIVFLILVVMGLRQRSPALLISAGIVSGLDGLTSPESFFVGLGVAVLISLFPGSLPRPVVAGALLIPSLAVYSVWFAPLLLNFLRLGGFVNTTLVSPIILTPGAILLSWGLVTPLGAYGAFQWLFRRRRDVEGRVVLALLLITAALLVMSSVIPRILGSGFTVVGRAVRYWPLLYLAAALLAGVGAAELLRRLGEWRVVAAAAAAAAMVALALPVPVNVNLDAYSRYRSTRSTEAVAVAVLGTGRNVLTEIASKGRGKCVIASPQHSLAMSIFAYTGYRHVARPASRQRIGNYARIPWRNIYEHIGKESGRIDHNQLLTDPERRTAAWTRVASHYRVNLVVTSSEEVDAFSDLFPQEVVEARRQRGRFVVLSVRRCRRA